VKEWIRAVRLLSDIEKRDLAGSAHQLLNSRVRVLKHRHGSSQTIGKHLLQQRRGDVAGSATAIDNRQLAGRHNLLQRGRIRVVQEDFRPAYPFSQRLLKKPDRHFLDRCIDVEEAGKGDGAHDTDPIFLSGHRIVHYRLRPNQQCVFLPHLAGYEHLTVFEVDSGVLGRRHGNLRSRVSARVIYLPAAHRLCCVKG
jgi:hypothetical protein